MSLVIALEGLDGSGKSTLARAVKESLKNIVLTKEPGSPFSSTCQQLRSLVLNSNDLTPLERELLFYADASIHSRYIQSLENSIVLSDRGLWSHIAYCRAYLKTKQIDYDAYSLCRRIIDLTCYEPDVVVYLEADLQLMQERSKLRGEGKDVIESNGDAFFSVVLETYKDLLAERQRQGLHTLVLKASEPICVNSLIMLNYLKEIVDSHDNRENIELC